jgi:hypothetical protein
MYAPYMTVYLVISLPNIPYMHRILNGSGQPYSPLTAHTFYTHTHLVHFPPGVPPQCTAQGAFYTFLLYYVILAPPQCAAQCAFHTFLLSCVILIPPQCAAQGVLYIFLLSSAILIPPQCAIQGVLYTILLSFVVLFLVKVLSRLYFAFSCYLVNFITQGNLSTRCVHPRLFILRHAHAHAHAHTHTHARTHIHTHTQP